MIVFMKNLMTVVLAVALLFSPAVSDDEIASDNEVVYTELGIPLELHYEQTTSSVIPWDLEIYDEKLYIGAGDYDENTGPVYSMCFDIEQEEWLDVGVLRDEQISRFCQINGKLIAVGTDPMDDWSLGNYYVLGDDGWETVRSLPNGIHNFDMIEFDGKIFAGVGTEDVDETVAMSTDGGKSWTYIPLYKDGKPFDTSGYKWTRTYEFTQYNGQLYALLSFQLGFGSQHMIFRYEDGKMVWLSDKVFSLIGGISVGRKYWNGEFEFDGACYITANALYAIRDFSNQESYEKIEMPGGESVADAFLRDGVMYALAFKRDTKNKEYNVVIYKSTTGKTGSFTPVAEFTYPVPPVSFDTDGNHFYVGMGYTTNVTAKCGMVLRIKPKA